MQKRKGRKSLHRKSILRGKRAGMSRQATNGNNSILKEKGIVIDPKGELYVNSIPTNKELLTICLSVLNGKWCSYEDNIPNGEILKVMKECQKYISPMEAVIHMSKSKVYRQERVLSYRQITCIELANELLIEKRYVAALHEFMDAIDDFGIVRKEDRDITIAEYILYRYTVNKFITSCEQEII